MPLDPRAILNDPAVLAALKKAWQDSHPGVTGGHEEGGFILRDALGRLSAVRWPKGAQDTIILPPHLNCKMGEDDIVATFHTHPNIGDNYLQGPGETDKRAVRDDPDLKGTAYVGEFVISQATIYIIMPNGQGREMGDTRKLFSG
jgi:hypothetical protein